MTARRSGAAYRVVAVVLVLVALVAAGLPVSAGGSYWTRTKQIAPGVKWTRINYPKGPNRVHVVSIELAQASTIDVMLAADKLPGFERTSSMASRAGAIAAINGDYAYASGRPVLTFARDAVLEQTQLTPGKNFAVDREETGTFIGLPKPRVWMRDLATGAEAKINRVNVLPLGYDEVNLYTPSGGSVARPPTDACSARLYKMDGPRVRDPEPGVAADYYVESVVCREKRLWAKGGVVVSTRLGGPRDPEIRSLIPGQQFTIGWSLANLVDVVDTIGGNPTLVENGAIVDANVTGTAPFFRRHPRTGVGTTSDGRVLFVTVDGRQKGYSVGMTLKRFAKLFRALGADRALNLDGGGSTTMWVDGRVRNRPSDGTERGVSTSLVLLPGADPGEESLSERDDGILPPLPPRSETWESIASDPASTGGLVDALRREGVSLPAALERAADEFRNR